MKNAEIRPQKKSGSASVQDGAFLIRFSATFVRGVHQYRHVSVRMAVLEHRLMRESRFRKREGFRKAGAYFAACDEVVQSLAFFEVGKMRTLEPLLPHPMVPEIEGRGISGRSGAYDDHSSRSANEARSGNGGCSRMLEDDGRIPPFPESFPKRFAKTFYRRKPLRERFGIIRIW